ncbi:DUF1840 domain-containing protein [Photobacterium carnosum]|jgi:hypothetical protein|uniref:DUF1840 domain-containing protein n=1 Tax=Photobacterium carnosum TaxID=2023717 RepID=A0A2N4UVJ6_9GAMM|nr:DUF1840 domain-containing protein [Photobacterium carnosum]KAE8177282.1 hypothetical protein CIT27_08255 [Photobacterium carnosum]MBY3787820.1 DUF1840 domain-containing protein [Photobacterium carnosum]MCD9494200.1 DUF1840 family protein [Photobacterium carnosum]MCD9498942.1 DUF1840 family protein [Photobacterium carnosum]MCD9514260.1 DUF1840 family protein [Photobacterium carnosum]
MLVTFSSKSHNNVTMFGDIAQSLITMMEFTTEIPGAITAEDVGSALANLEKNLTVAKQQQVLAQNTQQVVDVDNDDNEKEVKISIVVRAIPLIDLLKTAISVKSYVMWK